MAETARLYQTCFGFEAELGPDGRMIELTSPDGGAIIVLHRAAKGQKQGQTLVKLVFDVEDVEAFRDACRTKGLTFGPIHDAGDYQFANAKDPDKNTVSISSWAFRGRR